MTTKQLLEEFGPLLDKYECLVDNCPSRLTHWTRDHRCERCGKLGHSDSECLSVEDQRLLKIIIKLQVKHHAKKNSSLVTIPSAPNPSQPTINWSDQQLYPTLATWGFLD